MACYCMRPDFAAQMGRRTALRKGGADSGVEKLWVVCMFTLFLLWVSSAEGRILRGHHSQGKQSLYTHRNGSSPPPAQPAASPSPDLKKSSHSSGGSDCSIDDLNECSPPMDPTFGSYKRLVPNGPNPLHNR